MNVSRSTTTIVTDSIDHSPVRGAFLLIPLVLACFALSPAARAVSPAPDGGYANMTTAEGTNALFKLTTGLDNTANGFEALYSNTTGNYNTAVGWNALFNNIGGTAPQGSYNTATGASALYSNKTGAYDTAIGAGALYSNTTASYNTATGSAALASNTTGQGNTATGSAALEHSTTANGNTATGTGALGSTVIGSQNTATGDGALFYNTSGGFNTANGDAALYNNTVGAKNTADGVAALNSNTNGGTNIALGFQAGYKLATGDNNIDIGNIGVASESNTIRIGNAVATVYPDSFTHPAHTATYIAGIYGRSSGGIAVYVNSAGKLGTVASSRRFKEDIKPMDKASEAILALKPVTFRYKKEIDPDATPQFGLVAEDVAKANPDLIARDAQGKVYTVRYDAVNAMLLNEFLKEHRTVQEQQKEISGLRAELKAQRAELNEQKVLIRKVDDKVELGKPAPQTVLTNQ